MKFTKIEKALKALENNAHQVATLKEKEDTFRWDEKDFKAASEVNQEKRFKIIEGFYLKDNLKAAIFEEAFPAVLEVFKKYNGKQYGKATKEKIYNECKKMNLSVWVEGYYSDTLNITLINPATGCTYSYNNISVEIWKSGNGSQIVNKSNTIEAGEVSDYKISNNIRTTNAAAAAKKYLKEIEKIKEKEESFRKEIESFNDFTPSTIDHVSNAYLRYPNLY